MATKKSKNDELRVNPQSGGIEMKGPQFYAFLDTNAWVYRVRLLRAPLGKALKHGVLNRFGRFGMSEVVQFEVVEHATRLLLDRAEDARSAIDSLSEVLGKTLKVEVPNPAEAAAIVESWMKNVQAVSKCLSMDIRHARSALNRVLRKEPPNKPRNKANGKPDEGKNGQQFKDSVIWEHVRELADEAPVHFVTDDTDFFQDMKYENGLAAALLSDANSARYEITVFRDVGTLITHLGGAELMQVDTALLVSSIAPHLETYFAPYARQFGLSILPVDPHDAENEVLVFPTDDPQLSATTFEIRRQIASAHGVPSQNRYLVAIGSGSPRAGRERRGDVELSQMEVRDERGEPVADYPVRRVFDEGTVDLIHWDSGVGGWSDGSARWDDGSARWT